MDTNVKAFLWVIRKCEGTSDDNGYGAMFGHRADKPKLISSFADHPRVVHTWGAGQKTTAAGAYQFLTGTWDECVKAIGLKDFSPESQDRAAVFLISRRGALRAVAEGDLEAALKLCSKEWASLPWSPYGQPTRTYKECVTFFKQAGGRLKGEPESPPAIKVEEVPLTPAQKDALTVDAPAIPAPPQPEPQQQKGWWNKMAADWKAIVRTVAPALAGALGSPIAGAATKVLADALLGDPNAPESQVAQAVMNATPDDLLKIREADQKFALAMKQANIDVLRLDVEDRKSARVMFPNLVPTERFWIMVLAYLIIAIFGGCVYWVLALSGTVNKDPNVLMLIGAVIGYASAKADQVVSFFFGSSSGSRDKTDKLSAALEQMIKR